MERTLGRWVWPPFHAQNWYLVLYSVAYAMLGGRESVCVVNYSNCAVLELCICICLSTESHGHVKLVGRISRIPFTPPYQLLSTIDS